MMWLGDLLTLTTAALYSVFYDSITPGEALQLYHQHRVGLKLKLKAERMLARASNVRRQKRQQELAHRRRNGIRGKSE